LQLRIYSEARRKVGQPGSAKRKEVELQATHPV
jgi:hypothetical protein